MIDLLFFSESTYYFEQKQQIILYLINDRVSPRLSLIPSIHIITIQNLENFFHSHSILERRETHT